MYDPGSTRQQATDHFLLELEQANHTRHVHKLEIAAVVGAGVLLLTRQQNTQFQVEVTPEDYMLQRRSGESEANFSLRQLNEKFICGNFTYPRWLLFTLRITSVVLILTILFPYSEIGIVLLITTLIIRRKSTLRTDSGKLNENEHSDS